MSSTETYLIVAGSRNFNNRTLAYKVLNKLKEYLALQGRPIAALVCGMAKGADLLGYQWAKDNNLPILEYPANWAKYGKQAGYLRNKEMSEVGNYLLAFWDGKSPGTKIMIDLMKQAEKEYCVAKIQTQP